MSAAAQDPSAARVAVAWQQTVEQQVDELVGQLVDEPSAGYVASHRRPGQPESPVPCLLGLLGSAVSALVIGVGLWLLLVP